MEENPGELPQSQGKNSISGSQKRHITPLRYKNSSGSRDRHLRVSGGGVDETAPAETYTQYSPINIADYNRQYPGGKSGSMASIGDNPVNTRSPISIKWHEYIMSLLNGDSL